MRWFFGFWWCIAFAILSFVLLLQAIQEGTVGWAWMNGIALVLWLFWAWDANRREAIEAKTGDDNDDWSPPDGHSKR